MSDSFYQNIDTIIAFLQELRDSEKGCPWSREQTFASLCKHTIEESYELADAIESGDINGMQDELGDLLYHIIFYSTIAEEQQLFTLADIAQRVLIKHHHRRPNESIRQTLSKEETAALWEKKKWIERHAKSQAGILDGVALQLPAITRAEKLQRRAANVGFDWKNIDGIYDKIQEEMNEIKAVDHGDQDKLTEELGDLLFSCINLARYLNIDAETALRLCNKKFTQRFTYIERHLNENNLAWSNVNIDILEDLWQASKSEET